LSLLLLLSSRLLLLLSRAARPRAAVELLVIPRTSRPRTRAEAPRAAAQATTRALRLVCGVLLGWVWCGASSSARGLRGVAASKTTVLENALGRWEAVATDRAIGCAASAGPCAQGN
jgi:hypothetical protein